MAKALSEEMWATQGEIIDGNIAEMISRSLSRI